MSPYSKRRAALKGRILQSLAITVNGDSWDTWWEDAAELGLSDDTLGAVQMEVVLELERRAARLPTMEEVL